MIDFYEARCFRCGGKADLYRSTFMRGLYYCNSGCLGMSMIVPIPLDDLE